MIGKYKWFDETKSTSAVETAKGINVDVYEWEHLPFAFTVHRLQHNTQPAGKYDILPSVSTNEGRLDQEKNKSQQLISFAEQFVDLPIIWQSLTTEWKKLEEEDVVVKKINVSKNVKENWTKW